MPRSPPAAFCARTTPRARSPSTTTWQSATRDEGARRSFRPHGRRGADEPDVGAAHGRVGRVLRPLAHRQDRLPVDRALDRRGHARRLALLVVRISRTQTDTAGRKRRLDIGEMSSTERRWALATFAFVCGAIAW